MPQSPQARRSHDVSRQRIGRCLRATPPAGQSGQPNSLLSTIHEIGDLAWLAVAQQALATDFDDLVGRFPERLVKDASGRLRWRR